MKPRLSFQGWILGGCLVVVVSTLIFVAVVLESSLNGHMLELVRSSMQREILTVREVVRDRWQEGQGIAASDRLADNLGRTVGARVTIITPEGKVLGDSEMAREGVSDMANHADRPEIVQAMANGEGSSVRYSSTLGLDLMYTALRVDLPDGHKLLVRLAMPLSQVQQVLNRTRSLVLWAVFLGVLLSIGVAYLVARSLSRPVQKLTRTAASIAAGDLSRRFIRYPRHEIGELGRAFDQMADNMQGTIDDITRSRDRLEAILRGMVEGVLVIDSDGHVLLANRALMEMLELKAVPPGRLPSEIIRNADLLEALDEARAGRDYVWREIQTLGNRPRYLEAHVVRINGEAGPGLVCVLHDITERKRMEKMRRDLVANVSHELRTPLTAVRGAAETLLDGALDNPQYGRHFAELILRQSHRLERLVQDLLELSRLESGESPPRPRPINAAELADSVVEAVTDLAEGSGVELERRLPAEPPDLRRRRPPGGAGGLEPAGQRHQVHRPWGPGEPGHGGPGGRGGDQRAGHRPGHRRRTPAPAVRALLPGGHQPLPGDGGHRAGLGHCQTHRPGASWPGGGGQRPGQGQHLPADPSLCQGGGSMRPSGGGEAWSLP